MRLKDKVSIITGGGSGMGRVASLMFAAEEIGRASCRERV